MPSDKNVYLFITHSKVTKGHGASQQVNWSEQIGISTSYKDKWVQTATVIVNLVSDKVIKNRLREHGEGLEKQLIEKYLQNYKKDIDNFFLTYYDVTYDEFKESLKELKESKE